MMPVFIFAVNVRHKYGVSSILSIICGQLVFSVETRSRFDEALYTSVGTSIDYNQWLIETSFNQSSIVRCQNSCIIGNLAYDTL